MLFLLVALCAVALDQYSKYWIVSHLPMNQCISFDLLDIRQVHNTGAAFGMMAHATWLFIAIAATVVVMLLTNLPRILRSPPLVSMSLGLIAGGAVGNLIDRLRFGYVVDFIDLRWWPVFNLADSCICVGVGFLLWRLSQRPRDLATEGPQVDADSTRTTKDSVTRESSPENPLAPPATPPATPPTGETV